MAIACTSAEPQSQTPEIARPSFAPIFFFDGDGLIPEYVELGDEEVADQLLAALVAGPERSDLSTEIPEGAVVRGEFERNETLFLDLSEAFWTGSYAEIRKRIAQVLYTYAALEEGRTVRLLAFEGRTTRRLRALIAEPLERSDVEELGPWILPVRPVAGSIVSTSLPIEAHLRDASEGRVEVIDPQAEEPIAEAKLIGGKALLDISLNADATLIVRISAEGHHVDVEVTFVAP
jgi:hypothetical protein